MIRYFDSVDICKVRPDWRETRVEGTFPANAREVFKMVKLTVFYTTEVEVGVFQEGIRSEMFYLSNNYFTCLGRASFERPEVMWHYFRRELISYKRIHVFHCSGHI